MARPNKAKRPTTKLKKASRVWFLVGVLFSVIGCLFLAGSYYTWREANRLERYGIHWQAEVTDIVESKSEEGSTMYSPKISLYYQGDTVEVYSGLRSSNIHYTIGEKLEVVFPEGKPYAAKINSTWELYFVPIVLVFLGSIFTLVGMVSAYKFKG